jgi:hypothetical protein
MKTLALLSGLVLLRRLSPGINELMLVTVPVFLHGSFILLIVDWELASMAINYISPYIVLCGLWNYEKSF